jgi:hypothetical protein
MLYTEERLLNHYFLGFQHVLLRGSTLTQEHDLSFGCQDIIQRQRVQDQRFQLGHQA